MCKQAWLLRYLTKTVISVKIRFVQRIIQMHVLDQVPLQAVLVEIGKESGRVPIACCQNFAQRGSRQLQVQGVPAAQVVRAVVARYVA